MATRMTMSMRRRAALWLSLGLALTLAGCATPTQTLDAGKPCGLDAATRQRVVTLVQALVDRGHAPGAVVDIRCQGQRWLEHSAGLADVARAQAMRQDHLFRIYSMTKPITSLAVLMLADDGRIALDDPVAKHLPEFASATVYSGEAAGVMKTEALRRPLTVRDLLRHSAGIPYQAPSQHPVLRRYVARGIDNGSGQKFVPGDGSAPVDSVAELSRRIASIPLLHQPGTQFTYGGATDLLGDLVERVSGQPLGTFFNQRLFVPLAMADTAFQVPANKLDRLTAAYSAASQRPGDGGVLNGKDVADAGPSQFNLADDPRASVFGVARAIQFGGAGLVSSAADYQRLLTLWLPRAPPVGPAGARPLVSAPLLDEMTRNQLGPEALSAASLGRQGLGFGLGLAVFMNPELAPRAVPKGGSFWGGAASTFFWIDRQRGITGVLMTQVFGGDVAPYFTQLMEAVQEPSGKDCTNDSTTTAQTNAQTPALELVPWPQRRQALGSFRAAL